MSTPEPSYPSTPCPSLDPLVERVELFAREKPAKAVSAAFGAGILLALLPLGGILTALIRILFLLLRPVLIILGLIRLYEQFGGRCCKAPTKTNS